MRGGTIEWIASKEEEGGEQQGKRRSSRMWEMDGWVMINLGRSKGRMEEDCLGQRNKEKQQRGLI